MAATPQPLETIIAYQRIPTLFKGILEQKGTRIAQQYGCEVQFVPGYELAVTTPRDADLELRDGKYVSAVIVGAQDENIFRARNALYHAFGTPLEDFRH